MATAVGRRERILLLLAAAFLVVGTATLALSGLQSLLLPLALAVWAASFGVTHILLNRYIPHRDPFLLPVAALLAGCGLLLVARLAVNFLLRQTTWLFISACVLGAVVWLSEDLRWLRRFRYTWLFGGLALLATTLVFGVNPSGYGPRLWLGAGGVYLQPSEPLKLLMVVYLASYLAERKVLLVSEGRRIGRWRLPPLAYVGPLLAMFGLAVVLLAWQQDLGAAMLFFFTFLAMLYLATGQWGYVAAGFLLLLVAGTAGYLGSDRVALRVDAWLNPWPEAAGRAFQIVQSLLAFGAGGVFGQGLGLGSPTYIPAVHTDFVFAAIGEEFGLAGALAVIGLYGILALRGLRTAAATRQPFAQLLAAGLTAGLVIQAWVIMAGNAKLAPIAGVTLPFVSYGGSSLVTTFIALALLLRISDGARSHDTPIPARTERGLFHLAGALSVTLLLLATTCGFWATVRAEPLRARADNPRRVLYEQQIVRGRILDRNGTVLADRVVGDDGTVTRSYPIPHAAPAVGYASLHHGTGGIEAAFDAELRGEAGKSGWQATWDQLLHRPPRGQDVQLTLDATLQVEAQQALEGSPGAIVLLDASTGDILAMASSPTFDPEHLDDTWDALREDPAAPLVNRATQGLYQPGTALQTVVLAEALAKGVADLSAPVPEAARLVAVNGTAVSCTLPLSESATLAYAYAAACPAAFADLGEVLGADGLAQAVERWALTRPPRLEVVTEAADWTSDAIPTTNGLRSEAIGQGRLTVSPLQMALLAATVANEGAMPTPRLVLHTHGADDQEQVPTAVEQPRTILTSHDARELLAAWQRYGADEPGEPGLVAAHWGFAVAGEDRPPHVWLLGVAPPDAPRYALAVLLEHPRDPTRVVEIGRELLEATAP